MGWGIWWGKHLERNNTRKVSRDEKTVQPRTKVHTLCLPSLTLKERNKHLPVIFLNDKLSGKLKWRERGSFEIKMTKGLTSWELKLNLRGKRAILPIYSLCSETRFALYKWKETNSSHQSHLVVTLEYFCNPAKVPTKCIDWPSQLSFPAMPLPLSLCWVSRGNSFTRVQSRHFPKVSSCLLPSPQGFLPT